MLPHAIRPASEAEVAAVEQRLGHPLPAALHELLIWCGHGLGNLMRDALFLLPALLDHHKHIHTQATRLLQADGIAIEQLEQAIIFFMRHDTQFAFVRTGEGEDPPVYFYTTGDEIVPISSSVSAYVLHLVEGGMLFAGRVHAYQLDDLYHLSQPDSFVTTLSLNAAQTCTSIPERIFDFTNLRDLDVRFLGLRSLSPRIGELQRLRLLNLSVNRLRSLPPELGHLEQLESLFLSNNRLTSVIETFASLPHLRYARIDGNRIPDAEIARLHHDFPYLDLHIGKQET